MAVVGKLTFETEIDTKNFENKLNKLKNKLTREKLDLQVKEEKIDLYKNKLKQATKELEDAKNKQKELNDEIKQSTIEYEVLNKKSLEGGSFTGTEARVMDNLYNNIQSLLPEQVALNQQIEELTNKVNEANVKVSQATSNYQKNKNAVKETTQEIKRLKEEKENANKPKIDEDGGGFKGLSGIIKKITKIGLGLVGLRTGMALLRNSISTVASQNDEIATKINTIKSAIANALTPVVQYVINLFAKLVAYAGYLIKAWTGKDIFKNSAKSTNKMKNNIGGANKEASKLKRTLAGFDEMNILQKDGGVSTGGGGGGVSNVDMDMFKDIEIPKWVDEIAKKGELIKEILIGIATGITALKLGSFLLSLMGVEKTLPGIFGYLSQMSNLAIFGLVIGIATTIVGIVNTIEALLKWIGDPTWANFRDVLSGLSTVLIGVGIAMVALNASNPVGWILLAIGAVGKLVTAYFEQRDATKRLEQAQNNLNDAQQKYINASKQHMNAYDNLKKAQKEVKETADKYHMSTEELLKTGKELDDLIINQGKDIGTLTTKERAIYEAYLNNLDAEEQLKKTKADLKQADKDRTDASIKLNAETVQQTKNYKELGEQISNLYKSSGADANQLISYVGKLMENMDEETRKTFVEELPNDIKFAILSAKNVSDDALAKKYVLKFGVNTSSFQDELSRLKTNIKDFLKNPFKIKFTTSGYAKGGIVGYAKGGVVDLPRLAPGGLINRPGPGVAIGGERGTEGVVPLTDSQQMARLGEAIGRYVNIRAEIPVSVGNRQIAREIRNINAEESFAYNG